MFFTLNSCPSYLIRLYWKAIYGEKSILALLASNIVKKSKDDFKKDAFKIYAKITKMLGFQYTTSLHDGKNLEFRKNINNVKGNKHCEILVSCSDEERNCMQAQGTACKNASSCNCMQDYVASCKLM